MVSMPKIKTSKKTNKSAPAPLKSNPVVAAAEEKSIPTRAPAQTAAPAEQPHFDVTQAIYSQIKGLWAWGKTVPLLENLLSANEWIVNAILDATLKTDLLAIDKDHAQPILKNVDDNVFTPTARMAGHVWGFIAPSIYTADEFVVQPIVAKVMEKMSKNERAAVAVQ